jgi:hypothetical protein
MRSRYYAVGLVIALAVMAFIGWLIVSDGMRGGSGPPASAPATRDGADSG